MYDGPIIDTFLHGPWIGPDSAERIRADRMEWIDDPRMAKVMRTFKHDEEGNDGPRRLSVAEILTNMDRCGVERGILATKVYYPARAESVIALNRSFSEMSQESAGRLKWIASLIPPEQGSASYWDVMENSRLIAAIAHDSGLCGIHITPSPWGIVPNDRWFYPAYAKCVEVGLPLFTYVGAPGPLWPMETNNPAYLDDVALAFPQLRIIAHHIGDPWTDMSVRLAARHENFYICTSAWSPKAFPAALREFLAGRWHGVMGCDKVLFASDYPLMNLERTVRDARSMNLSPEKLSNFLFNNANHLFWND